MSQSRNMNKKELVKQVSIRLGRDIADVEPVVEATIEEIYESLKHRRGVTLRNFGTFYIDERHSGTAFKFNPAQRLRAVLGWTSTYKGDL